MEFYFDTGYNTNIIITLSYSDFMVEINYLTFSDGRYVVTNDIFKESDTMFKYIGFWDFVNSYIINLVPPKLTKSFFERFIDNLWELQQILLVLRKREAWDLSTTRNSNMNRAEQILSDKRKLQLQLKSIYKKDEKFYVGYQWEDVVNIIIETYWSNYD